jgi:hypothetical protein
MPRRIHSRLALLPAALVVCGLVVPAAHPLAASAALGPDAPRLVVLWRTPNQTALRFAGAAQELHGLNKRRSVVIARPGQSQSLAAQLRSDSNVLAVVPDVLVTVDAWPATAPNDPYYGGSQADLGVMGVPTAWQTTTGLASVVVAVLDTGMFIGHVDLDGVNVVSPRNEITNTTDVADGHGHGTHVIGEIAAETDNGTGVAGIAPGVSIMPVKVLSDSGSGWFSDILDGIDWARTHGATVISMSLGGSLDPTSAAYYQPVIDSAYNAGITLVAAAGNNGDGTISYPGAFNHILSIAATNNADQHASFSNANTTVDLAAPGVSILSTYRTGGYVSMSGTSTSTPHVAAVAGLVRSAHPTATVDEVEAALRETAVDLGTAGRDNVFGSGRVNAAAAVAWTPAAPTPTPTPAPTPSPTPIPSPSAITVGSPVAGLTMTASTGIPIAWTESGDPFLSRSIQRQRAAAGNGACGSFGNDGQPANVAGSPVGQTVSTGYCYRWVVSGSTAGATVTGTSGSALVDSAVPTTGASVTGAGNGGWKSGLATVTLTSSAKSGSTLSYRIDGGSTMAYAGPFAVTGNGQHSIAYWAIGGTGITSSTRTLTVRIDTTRPTAMLGSIRWTGTVRRYSISVSTSDGSGSGVASKRLYYARAGGTYRLWGTIGPTATTFNFKAPTTGTYSLYVRATDVAGNVSPTPSSGSVPIVVAKRLMVRR